MQLNSISQFLLCCQQSSYIFYCLNKLIPYNRLQKHQSKKKKKKDQQINIGQYLLRRPTFKRERQKDMRIFVCVHVLFFVFCFPKKK